MTVERLHLSIKILMAALVMAIVGVMLAISNVFPGTDSKAPLDAPNSYILMVTFLPLVILSLTRLLLNIFSPVHSSRERAGQVACLIGLLHLSVLTVLYVQLGRNQSVTTVQAVYGFLAILGIFLLLLGDVLRNFERVQSSPDKP